MGYGIVEIWLRLELDPSILVPAYSRWPKFVLWVNEFIIDAFLWFEFAQELL